MLTFVTQLLDWISRFAPQPLAIIAIALAALLIVVNRPKLGLAILLGQYILVALLIGPRVYGPLVLLRAGLGFAVYLILLVSTSQLQDNLLINSWRPNTTAQWTYRVCQVAIGSLVAYGLWRVNLLHLDNYVGWVGYGFLSYGLILAVASSDPLRLGLGILVAINGFEVASAFMHPSLLVLGMWGVVDTLLALTIAFGMENWLHMPSAGEP